MSESVVVPGPDDAAARGVWFAHLQRSPGVGEMHLTAEQWTILAQEAIRHQLGSLTYRLLADGPLASQVPPAVHERLRARYLDYAVRNAVMLRRTAEMAAALGRSGIPVILLKGIHLCRFVYAEPALRTMADVDLMVPRNRLAESERVFLDLGFGPLPRPDLEDFCRWSNHLAKLHKEGAPVVELHWSIERPTAPFRIDLEGLWHRSRPAKLESTEIRLLSPEDLLLHLALHGSFHHEFGRSALKALVDVDAVIRRHGQELDWTTLASRANEWGAGQFMYTTLRLVQETLATPVPPTVLRQLDHTPGDEDVVETARRLVLLPEVDVPNRYVALATARSMRERARMVTDAVFLPREAMERMYHLRRHSPWVYPAYLWRIADLLVRRGQMFITSLFRTRTVRPALERETDRDRIGDWVRRRIKD